MFARLFDRFLIHGLRLAARAYVEGGPRVILVQDTGQTFTGKWSHSVCHVSSVVPIPVVLPVEPSTVVQFQGAAHAVAHNGKQGVSDIPPVLVPLALPVGRKPVDLDSVKRKVRPHFLTTPENRPRPHDHGWKWFDQPAIGVPGRIRRKVRPRVGAVDPSRPDQSLQSLEHGSHSSRGRHPNLGLHRGREGLRCRNTRVLLSVQTFCHLFTSLRMSKNFFDRIIIQVGRHPGEGSRTDGSLPELGTARRLGELLVQTPTDLRFYRLADRWPLDCFSERPMMARERQISCLLYTSDAADE